MAIRPFFTSSAGVRHYWEDLPDGSVLLHSYQDTDAIIDRNKAMAAHNDGYSPSRELRRVGSVPLLLVHKWLAEEGWNALDNSAPEKLAQKLNDSDFRDLRTASGRVAVVNGVLR